MCMCVCVCLFVCLYNNKIKFCNAWVKGEAECIESLTHLRLRGEQIISM